MKSRRSTKLAFDREIIRTQALDDVRGGAQLQGPQRPGDDKWWQGWCSTSWTSGVPV